MFFKLKPNVFDGYMGFDNESLFPVARTWICVDIIPNI